MVCFNVLVSAPKTESKIVRYRNLKDVDFEQFKRESKEGYDNMPKGDMQCTVQNYNSVMQTLTDKYAPLKSRKIRTPPSAPWFDSEYKQLWIMRRRAEKIYKRSGLPGDKDEFIRLQKETTKLAFKKKHDYYSKKIENCNSSKNLYACANKLLDIRQKSLLPSSISNIELANRFKDYFKEKINCIQRTFQSLPSSDVATSRCDGNVILAKFEPSTEDEIRSIIMTHGINCSPLDPVPADLLKESLDTFIPIWTDIVNLSLSQGSIDSLKIAVIVPLLKELDHLIDADNLKNYRPVSNLVSRGKLIERVVTLRLDKPMDAPNLHSVNQYGYKKNHSTELLLMKVVNDLLLSCDKKISIVVMFLDLSAAFDTIDQCMLLQILRNEIGVCDLALKWFESFLIGRTQTVKINDAYSDETGLDFGFAQASILGPKLFNIYTRSFPGTIHSIGQSVEGYADDQQIWKEFSTMFQVSALGKNIDCVSVLYHHG